MGNTLNTLAFGIFAFIAGIWGVLGTIILLVFIDPEIEKSGGEIEGLIFIWAVTAVFGFLAIFFYKRMHRHYEKTTSPQQKAREKKELLTITLPSAAFIGIVAFLWIFVFGN